jgi:hypothetical protein
MLSKADTRAFSLLVSIGTQTATVKLCVGSLINKVGFQRWARYRDVWRDE